MADFLTRIALLGEGLPPPIALDDAMKLFNFSRQYISTRGIRYELPEGTYFSQSFNMSAADVRNLAVTAILGFGTEYDIVTVGGEIACFLHPAR